MKLFFVALFLIPVLCLSQQKKDTKVMASISDTTNQLNKVAMYFLENGYTINQKDADLKFVSTNEKTVGSMSIKINALIKDSVIVFTGEVANNVTMSFGGVKVERTFYPISFAGMKGSDLRKAWEILVSIGKQFGSVSYSK